MKRPPPRTPTIPPDLGAVAGRAEYVGSSEHKNRRSWLGLPQPRRRGDVASHATICPLVTEEEKIEATRWVRTAIRSGQFDPGEWRNGFPRYIWYRDPDGQHWYGFLTNQGAGDQPTGSYKGWPITEEEKRATFG